VTDDPTPERAKASPHRPLTPTGRLRTANSPGYWCAGQHGHAVGAPHIAVERLDGFPHLALALIQAPVGKACEAHYHGTRGDPPPTFHVQIVDLIHLPRDIPLDQIDVGAEPRIRLGIDTVDGQEKIDGALIAIPDFYPLGLLRELLDGWDAATKALRRMRRPPAVTPESAPRWVATIRAAAAQCRADDVRVTYETASERMRPRPYGAYQFGVHVRDLAALGYKPWPTFFERKE
jgi:hypothetical protein